MLEEDVRNAVKRYLDEHGGRLLDHYMKAIETAGTKRYRLQIMRAVASLDADYVTMEDLRTAVSAALGEEVPSTALSGPLRDLKTEDYGFVLDDVGRTVSGTRVHDVTRFRDPTMKSFVRFMSNLDATHLMPAPPEVGSGDEGAAST